MDWLQSLLGIQCRFCTNLVSYHAAVCQHCQHEWLELTRETRPETFDLGDFPVRAHLRYEGWVKNVILSQKENPQRWCANLIAGLIASSLPPNWRQKPLCWIPGSTFGRIHFVELLSVALSQHGLRLANRALLTRKLNPASKAQKNLKLESRSEIQRLLKKFRVNQVEDEKIGETTEVILLDDVLTTGTTLRACKLLLERHRGIKVLGALTLAYTPLQRTGGLPGLERKVISV